MCGYREKGKYADENDAIGFPRKVSDYYALGEDAESQENDSFRPLHQTDFAFDLEAFGSGADVANEDRSDYGREDQDHAQQVGKVIEVYHRAHKDNRFRIAIDYGIEQCTGWVGLVLVTDAGDNAIHRIKTPAEKD